VKVLAVWAETDADSEITVLHIKVTLTAGSPDINLLYTTIEAVKTVGDTTWEVSMEHSVLASGYLTETYTTTLLRDMNPVTDTGETMMSAGDIFEITIDMAGFTVAASLLTQDQMDISIMPKHGIPTYCTIVAPSTLPVSGFVSLK
jgi:flagellin FlaB